MYTSHFMSHVVSCKGNLVVSKLIVIIIILLEYNVLHTVYNGNINIIFNNI